MRTILGEFIERSSTPPPNPVRYNQGIYKPIADGLTKTCSQIPSRDVTGWLDAFLELLKIPSSLEGLLLAKRPIEFLVEHFLAHPTRIDPSIPRFVLAKLFWFFRESCGWNH